MRFLYVLAFATFAAVATPAAAQQLPQGPILQTPPIIRPGPPAPVCSATPAAIEDGLYSIRLRNGKSLDASGGGTFNENAAVIGWDHNGNPNQRWLITTVSPGRYLLRNASNAMAARANPLCAASASCMVGTTRATRGAEQQWLIEQTSTGHFRIRDGRTGKQLGIAGDIAANGGAAQTSPTQGCAAHQTFNITRIGAYRELSREAGIGRLMAINLRLNNYTPRQHEFDRSGERAFLKPNDANLSFQVGSDTFGPFAVALPVLELGPDRMFKTYVNEWSSRTTTISTNRRGAIVARVDFEDDGVEIITNCYNNANCHVGEPRFDLRNSRVEVTIRPRFDAARGSFTFDATTDFRFDMSESGPCVNNFWAFICDLALPDRASLLRTNVIAALDRNLAAERSVGRTGLELVLNSYAGGSGLRNVTVGPNGELIFF